MKVKSVTPMHHMHHLTNVVSSAVPRRAGGRLVAVVATLSKGYDLDYIWKQVDRGPVKDAASYYFQRERGRAARPLAGTRRPGPRLPARPDRRTRAL
jgi:hypothetical protein